MTGLGNPPTCSVQFVNDDFLGETICCVSFVPAFKTPTNRVYVCGDFVGNYSYVRNSYQPVLQSVGILHEELTDVTV